MAYATDISINAQGGLAARVAAAIATLRGNMARRKVFKETLRELNALSNRELADLGMGRSEIRRVAYQAAYEG
ncbi:DUF1127 domain-containing protein [Tropicibacter naphthalenivorans]|uniref:YjiS-like domain-containing protein n=1 Tax=Tropicibacter naphthalenivorans TaxID=441103 RepID=A0A0P1G365_9RHOB|nr:DUF1127 domain-containing protein [Tropicibacter naphthalenivorans]CUH76252.1 hypothetical protein TRN7648_00855 [Tropicibacter naphthalenivorans]SMC39151.1 Uncharacterized conserved protein YjiS, DUF1127 family [Tropicibacter naphthalenivorans]